MSTSTVANQLVSPYQTNPLYDYWARTWVKLAHCYEGSGGFLDGTYLVAHAREYLDHEAALPVQPSAKLKARRKLARYENLAYAIVQQKRSAIFRESITRNVGPDDKPKPHPIEDWWQNVDGKYCGIDDYVANTWVLAAIFGHVIHVMDRPNTEPAQTRADEAAPYLRWYSPIDMPDWFTDINDQLLEVWLLESLPRTPDSPATALRTRVRKLNAETWTLISPEGTTSGNHGFGTLPVAILYASRSALSGIVGKSVLNDPQLYIDDSHLTSEIREILRAQTFGLLNAYLTPNAGQDPVDLEVAKSMLSTVTGATNVVFSPNPLNYVQPDTKNIEVHQAERDFLRREIYRLASIPWVSDSKSAEAAASLALKREDMNQILAANADECEKWEYQIAKLWFRAYYGPDAWEKEWDDANVVIRYPDNFNITPFADVLQQAQAAMSLEFGPIFHAELKKRLVPKFLPDASPDTMEQIETEIVQGAQDKANQQDQMQQAELQIMQKQAETPVIPRPPKVKVA